MAMSSYRFGFEDGVLIRGMPIGITHPGNVYWVDSGSSSHGGRGDFRQPFATLGAALTYIASNGSGNGDLVMIKPGHSETITGAGGITMSSSHAGVAVIGMGTGSLRPTFLMDAATTVTVVITGANVSMKNLVFKGGHNTIATCFDIDAAGFTADGLEFKDNTTDEHFVIAFTIGSATDNTCDDITIENCVWKSEDAGITEFITLTGDTDNLTLRNNIVIVDAADAQFLAQASGDDLNGFVCVGNMFVTGLADTDDVFIDNDQSDNSGIVAYNLVGHHDAGGAVEIDVDGVRMFENYYTATDTTSGALAPTADTIT